MTYLFLKTLSYFNIHIEGIFYIAFITQNITENNFAGFVSMYKYIEMNQLVNQYK